MLGDTGTDEDRSFDVVVNLAQGSSPVGMLADLPITVPVTVTSDAVADDADGEPDMGMIIYGRWKPVHATHRS